MKVKITYNEIEKNWKLQLGDNNGIEYASLYRLAKTLMKWAKSQNL